MERKPLDITFHDPNPPGQMGDYIIKVLGSGISERVKTSVLAELTRLKQEQSQPPAAKQKSPAVQER